MDAAFQLDVFGHFCYMLGMYSAHDHILKQVQQAVFHGLLECHDGVHLNQRP